MSAANTGHAAYDADAEIRDTLAGLPDDEARAVFCVAALAHAEQQLQILEKQAENVTAKAEEIMEMWNAKVDEAVVMREKAADEVDRWQAHVHTNGTGGA